MRVHRIFEHRALAHLRRGYIIVLRVEGAIKQKLTDTKKREQLKRIDSVIADVKKLEKEVQAQGHALSFKSVASNGHLISRYTGLSSADVSTILMEPCTRFPAKCYGGWNVLLLSPAEQLLITSETPMLF